ncbi:hypothetical protein M8J76_004006 [Diaphorina citri]|nr:hypothetical protein M8J76_004006 [Diaphorina citri]
MLMNRNNGNRAADERWKYLILSNLSVATAMLCKEQGITVTALCAFYELFVTQKVTFLGVNTPQPFATGHTRDNNLNKLTSTSAPGFREDREENSAMRKTSTEQKYC